MTAALTDTTGLTEQDLSVQCAIELNDVRCPNEARWIVVIACGSCLRPTGPEPFCTGHKDRAAAAGEFLDIDGCGESSPVRVLICEAL